MKKKIIFAIALYASGKATPKLDGVVAIADYFKVSVDYLLGRVDSRTSDVNTQALAKEYGLTAEAIKTLKDMVAAKNVLTPEGNREFLKNMVEPTNLIHAPKALAMLNALLSTCPIAVSFFKAATYIIDIKKLDENNFKDNTIQPSSRKTIMDEVLADGFSISNVLYHLPTDIQRVGVAAMLCRLIDYVEAEYMGLIGGEDPLAEYYEKSWAEYCDGIENPCK